MDAREMGIELADEIAAEHSAADMLTAADSDLPSESEALQAAGLRGVNYDEAMRALRGRLRELAAALTQPPKIEIINIEAGATGAGGWDVDLMYGGVHGGVTLLPDHNGAPTAWGSPEHWVSGELLRRLRELPDVQYHRELDRLEMVARLAIASEGIDPEFPEED